MLFVIFSVVSFNIYLSLIFVTLITLCLGVFLLGFILPGTLHFLDMALLIHSCTPAAAKSLQSCPTLCDPIDGHT